jgi:hypothetical protein
MVLEGLNILKCRGCGRPFEGSVEDVFVFDGRPYHSPQCYMRIQYALNGWKVR